MIYFHNMHIVFRFDVGEIVDQKEINIPWDIMNNELTKLLSIEGAELLVDTLHNIKDKLANKRKQPLNGVTLGECLQLLLYNRNYIK